VRHGGARGEYVGHFWSLKWISEGTIVAAATILLTGFGPVWTANIPGTLKLVRTKTRSTYIP